MREEERYELEVHVAGICIRHNSTYEVLIAKRSDDRKIYPGKWECGGGQINPGESFEEALVRQLKEELNIDAEIIAPVGFYEIRADELDQKKIPGVYVVCKVVGGEPKVDNKELVELKWCPINEIKDMDLIPGMYKEILNAVEIFKQNEEGN